VATIVLVPGAWHGAWCWTAVAGRLREQGHEVHTPTLTGLAERAHLLAPGVDLETHITDVRELITWAELTDVVLCGHSYGGVVITGVADRIPARLRELVYVDAFVPAVGQSCTECANVPVPNGATARSPELAVPAPPAAFFGYVGPQTEWIEARTTPMPVAALDGRVSYREEVLADLPRTYVLASGWASNPHFQAAYERAGREPGWTAAAVAGSHELMISHPDELAAVIDARASAPVPAA
jgi:pimeloyl-ACP methyl ester carboxylesterase